MGYAAYTLPDGTKAGYVVEAPCDAEGCDTPIWRGLDALCGSRPGENEPGSYGCGRWFCTAHQWADEHDCKFPEYGTWSADEMQRCYLVKGHDGHHRDDWGKSFTT